MSRQIPIVPFAGFQFERHDSLTAGITSTVALYTREQQLWSAVVLSRLGGRTPVCESSLTGIARVTHVQTSRPQITILWIALWPTRKRNAKQRQWGRVLCENTLVIVVITRLTTGYRNNNITVRYLRTSADDRRPTVPDEH